MSLPRATVTARWIAAAAVGGGGFFLLARVMSNESNWVVIFGKSLFGLAALISGVLLIGPEIVGWTLTPLNHLLDRLFLPSESEPPPVDYTLARLYGSRMRYEEACEEYAKIIRYHPEQISAYLEGIDAAHRARDPGRPASFTGWRAGSCTRRTNAACLKTCLRSSTNCRKPPMKRSPPAPGSSFERKPPWNQGAAPLEVKHISG